MSEHAYTYGADDGRAAAGGPTASVIKVLYLSILLDRLATHPSQDHPYHNECPSADGARLVSFLFKTRFEEFDELCK